ncbi:hypothetical protein Xoosp13_137 [Xanthomonas phage Xoo-sp13]|nr:hypothetical protein Xoosp13_137 [Xanthomonas phage Xoo-sp13]
MSEDELKKVSSRVQNNYILNIAGIFTVYSALYLDGEPVENGECNSRLKFLTKFQQVHDGNNIFDITDVALWRSKVTDGLREIALKHGLDDSVATA